MDQMGNNQRNCAQGRNSVEELNQEIERLVLEDISKKIPEPTPEGHRAPIAELFALQRRSVSTQTPYSLDDSDEWDEDEIMFDCEYFERSSSSRDSAISEDEDDDLLADGSRCPSSAGFCCSPVHIVSGFDGKLSKASKEMRSTGVNKILTREPPDGCEKVKIVNEETMRQNAANNLSRVVLGPCPQKSGFVLLPSQSSAFLPLYNNHHHLNHYNNYQATAAAAAAAAAQAANAAATTAAATSAADCCSFAQQH